MVSCIYCQRGNIVRNGVTKSGDKEYYCKGRGIFYSQQQFRFEELMLRIRQSHAG